MGRTSSFQEEARGGATRTWDCIRNTRVMPYSFTSSLYQSVLCSSRLRKNEGVSQSRSHCSGNARNLAILRQPPTFHQLGSFTVAGHVWSAHLYLNKSGIQLKIWFFSPTGLNLSGWCDFSIRGQRQQLSATVTGRLLEKPANAHVFSASFGPRNPEIIHRAQTTPSALWCLFMCSLVQREEHHRIVKMI